MRNFGHRNKVVFLLMLLVIAACEKKETVVTHTDLVVSGNEQPPYDGIPEVQITNYVNKLYIDLTGLEPTDDELNDDVSYLQDNDLSAAARTTIVQSIISKDEFHNRLFQSTSGLLLNGFSESDIQDIYDENVFVRDFLYASGDTLSGQFMDFEVSKIEDLQAAKDDYKNGTATINEYFKRFCFNLIYDEINMGSENFVIACFENLLKRYPTETELENGVEMVDGGSVNVLLRDGNSKEDFLDIITHNNGFYEGRIIEAFQLLLIREPSSEEMSTYSADMVENGSIEEVWIQLTITDEYAGF